MKEEIKELRVKIDGLAQLVKHLTAAPLVLNMSSLPEGVDINTVMENWEKYKVFLAPIQPDYSRIERINSTELNKAYDSLILAKAWLGKMLQELGESTPYVNDGKRKTVGDIEPTTDKAEVVPGLRNPVSPGLVSPAERIDTWELNGRPMNDYDTMSHIEKVDWLRQEINILHMETTSKLNQILFNTEVFTDNYVTMNEYKIYIKQHLTEARFWLGFELQRIKENESTHS